MVVLTFCAPILLLCLFLCARISLLSCYISFLSNFGSICGHSLSACFLFIYLFRFCPIFHFLFTSVAALHPWKDHGDLVQHILPRDHSDLYLLCWADYGPLTVTATPAIDKLANTSLVNKGRFCIITIQIILNHKLCPPKY